MGRYLYTTVLIVAGWGVAWIGSTAGDISFIDAVGIVALTFACEAHAKIKFNVKGE